MSNNSRHKSQNSGETARVAKTTTQKKSANVIKPNDNSKKGVGSKPKRSGSPSHTTPTPSGQSKQKSNPSSKGAKDGKTATNTKVVKKAPSPKVGPRIYDEIITWDEAGKVARLDAKALASNIDVYVSANQFQYYVALNVWGGMWVRERDLGLDNLYHNWVLTHGLRSCELLCEEVANMLIDQVDREGIAETLRTELPDDTHWEVIPILLGEMSVDDAIDVLRFLKRFTPIKADKLEQETVNKFIEVLNETNWGLHARLISRDPTPNMPILPVMCKPMRKYLSVMLRNFVKEYQRSSYVFSSGVCTDGKNLVEKLARLSCCIPSLDDEHRFPLSADIRCYSNKSLPPFKGGRFDFIQDIPNKSRDAKALFVPKIGTVPKSLKTYRVIGPESSYSAYKWQRVRMALVNCMASCKYSDLFDCTNQDPNRVLAKSASIDGTYITVDLSAASDRISRHYMFQLLPDDVWEIISPLLPVGYNVEGKTYAPSIFLTMGNPATFMFLGMFTLACALAARDMHHEYTGEWTNMPYVFGDDALVDARCSEEFFSLLEHLGHKVNYDKTYLEHYRESCGVEFADGYPLTSDYWPRKTVIDPRTADEANMISSLVSLQHRLFWVHRSQWFLFNLVKWFRPDMTESGVGEDCQDLWSLYPNTNMRRSYAPLKEGLTINDLSDKIKDSGCVDRRFHMTVKQEPNLRPGWKELPPVLREAVEVYFYYRFLAEGPRFTDKLSELLRVSEPTDIELQAFKPVAKLTFKRS